MSSAGLLNNKSTAKKILFNNLLATIIRITQPPPKEPAIGNNKIVVMKMYRHATRADSAELAAEKNCRPASTKINDLEGAWRV